MSINGRGGRRGRKRRQSVARKNDACKRLKSAELKRQKRRIDLAQIDQLRSEIATATARSAAAIVTAPSSGNNWLAKLQTPDWMWPALEQNGLNSNWLATNVGPAFGAGFSDLIKLSSAKLSAQAESSELMWRASRSPFVASEKFSEGLSKLFITCSYSGDVNVCVFKDGMAKACVLYVHRIDVPNFDGSAFSAYGVGPESAAILLAAWQMTRELRMISRQIYIVGRTFIADRIWRGNERRRDARFRLTSASRTIEIMLPRPRPASENIFCNIRWRKRPPLFAKS